MSQEHAATKKEEQKDDSHPPDVTDAESHPRSPRQEPLAGDVGHGVPLASSTAAPQEPLPARGHSKGYHQHLSAIVGRGARPSPHATDGSSTSPPHLPSKGLQKSGSHVSHPDSHITFPDGDMARQYSTGSKKAGSEKAYAEHLSPSVRLHPASPARRSSQRSNHQSVDWTLPSAVHMEGGLHEPPGHPTALPQHNLLDPHDLLPAAGMEAGTASNVSMASWRRDATSGVVQTIGFDDMVRHRNKVRQRNEHRTFIIYPEAKWLHAWRTAVIVMVLGSICEAPLELAFHWWTVPPWLRVCLVIMDVLFMVDMSLNFFIAYLHQGRLEVRHRAIAEHYFRTWFLVDFVSNFPWDWAFEVKAGKGRKLVKVLKLPKVFRMARLVRIFREGAYLFGTMCSLVCICLFGHFSSCLWVFLLIDCEEDPPADSEVPECPHIVNAYAEGLSVGMAALGGSDGWLRFIVEEVSGRTHGFAWNSALSLEVELASVLTTLLGLCVVAVLFGNIAAGTTRATTQSRLFRERLSDLKSIGEHYHIPKDLYQRVVRHYFFVYACGSDTRQNVLHDRHLTVDLRRQLAYSFYGAFLQTVPFLECQEEGFMKSLCEKVDVEYCSPMDAIIEEGESGTDLYFLMLGRVRIESRKRNIVFRTLEEGSFFGEMGLLFPETNVSYVTVVAETAGWMLVVGRAALEALCTPDLMQVLRSIALERLHSFAEGHSKSTEFLWPHGHTGTTHWDSGPTAGPPTSASQVFTTAPESSHPMAAEEPSHSSQHPAGPVLVPIPPQAARNISADSHQSNHGKPVHQASHPSVHSQEHHAGIQQLVRQVTGFREKLRHMPHSLLAGEAGHSPAHGLPTTTDSCLDLQALAAGAGPRARSHSTSSNQQHIGFAWKASRRSSLDLASYPSPTSRSPAPAVSPSVDEKHDRRRGEHAFTSTDIKDVGSRLVGIELSVQSILYELSELNHRSRGSADAPYRSHDGSHAHPEESYSTYKHKAHSSLRGHNLVQPPLVEERAERGSRFSGRSLTSPNL